VRIHYEAEGEGPPLVLHHGMSDSLLSWREYGYAKPLKKDHQLVLIDGCGHGDSDRAHDPDAYTLPLRVGDVVAMLDELGIGKAHYLGYSLGGWIGLELAKYAPERLQSLIIGGAQPYGHSFEAFRQMLSGGMAAWVAAAEQMAGLWYRRNSGNGCSTTTPAPCWPA
jgi:pimeloyl-ACP methyl ester carboxylesterase